MRNDIDDDVLDVLLAERLEGAVPPNLAARVRAGWRRGEAAGAAARVAHAERVLGRRAAPGRTWLAAAVLLLGLGVVAAVVTLRELGGQPGGQPGDQPGDRLPAAPPAAADPGAEAAPQDPRERAAGPLRADLRVVDEHGGPVQTFELVVLRVAKPSPLGLARIPDFPARAVRPADFRGDDLQVLDLPEGEFVAAVLASPYVRTFSEPFRVAVGQPPPKVKVVLQRGGEVTGTVLGNDRAPLRAAKVRIEVDTGMPPDSPFAALLAGSALGVTELFTAAATETDEAGRFRFRGVVPGKYALVVEHSAYCVHDAGGLLVRNALVEAPPIVLAPGTIVSGVVRGADGEPAADLEVVIQEVDEAALTEGVRQVTRSSGPKSWKALSGQDGVYRVAQRLPPGRYQIRPGVPAGSNPLQVIGQIQKATRPFTLEAGADEVRQDLTVAW